ncbi:MAG TPA: type II toxin-antitoxin system CcdA family antitoxin [Kofleriaceae bacterium]|jgi:antitoxin CcdA|nr:type II toxin-antitoxin system CcdA family antitoxin [Kofleriaceae bacterium]
MPAAARSRSKHHQPAKHAPARRARKAATNLSLRIDLVQRAKALDLNLSEVVETALEQAILAAEQARWLAENEEALDYYNAFVEKHGLFGEEFREF